MSASSGMVNLQVCHEPVDDLGGRFECRLGQLGVDHGGLGIGVAQDVLDDAQIHALFQKMGGVGMAQGMDRGPLVDMALANASLKAIWTLATGMGFSAVSSPCPPRPGAGKSQCGLRWVFHSSLRSSRVRLGSGT